MRRHLSQLHREFMKECEFSVKLSPETLRGYQASFDLLVKVMPQIDLGAISPGILTEFFKRLEKRERTIGKNLTRKGIKKSSIATYRSKLNKFFEWLRIKGFLEENPFRSIAYPSVYYEDKKYLKREQIEKVFSALALSPGRTLVRKRNLAIFPLLLNCGLRRNELVSLKTYDVDLGRNTLLVRSETSKSRRDRTLPLNSSVVPILNDYLEERGKTGYVTPYFFVSSTHDGNLTKDGLKHLVDNLNNLSGVDFHLHQFRHTFAVNVLHNGCDIAKLKQLMGHTDIRMTMTYLRCLPTKAMRGDLEKLTFENLI
jgi:integrase/recombinase XerD